MGTLLLAFKLIVGLSILNVWTLNRNKASRWRGGEAKTIDEEFAAYGLPAWSVNLVGLCKIALSILLLASIQFPSIEKTAALGLAFFLSGSILMHIKINDPFLKSLPAAFFLILCLLIYAWS